MKKLMIGACILAGALGCYNASQKEKIREENQYTGSEPPKHFYENKLGTQQRLEDNSSRVPAEFRKK